MDKNQEYQDAFNEEMTAKPEISEEEAFGLMPEEVNAAETPAGDVASVAVVSPEPEKSAPIAAEAMPEEISSEDMQRQKSWEGRLKKREAELKAREDALLSAAPAEKTTPAIDEAGLQEAMDKLTEDFGEDFVGMITTIATGIAMKIAAETAGAKVSEIGANIKMLIGEIGDMSERAHFEKIYDAHPDFADVADDPEFQAWTDADPGRAQVVENGSARSVIALLTEWKDKNAPVEEGGDDDTEAVRSGGLKLPEPGPGLNKDYADAWKEF